MAHNMNIFDSMLLEFVAFGVGNGNYSMRNARKFDFFLENLFRLPLRYRVAIQIAQRELTSRKKRFRVVNHRCVAKPVLVR